MSPPGEGFHLVPGSVPLDKGPDGNSIFLDAPQGLIVIDTGRHPEHSARLLAYARERGRRIAAIVNSHWHLDHTTGNLDIRETYPEADVYATTAIEGALVGFLGRNRAHVDKLLADPGTPSEQRAQLLRGRHRIDHPDACSRSDADTAHCVAGWERDAATFIPDSHRDYVREAAGDYITTRLRSSTDEQQRFCKPLVAGAPRA